MHLLFYVRMDSEALLTNTLLHIIFIMIICACIPMDQELILYTFFPVDKHEIM